LSLQGFRHLRDDALELDPRVNVIQGANAAGKTSFLESIHFLARARSFLTHRTAQMVAKGKERALVHGQIRAAGTDHRLGVQYQKGQTRVRLDGRDVQALSESAGLLPIQVINTEGQRLLTDGPAERRAFLNWGVFHVEPAYREDWRRYQKALRQRNAALRAGDRRLVAAWEPAMVAAAEAVDRRRQAFLETLMPRAMAIATTGCRRVSRDGIFVAVGKRTALWSRCSPRVVSRSCLRVLPCMGLSERIYGSPRTARKPRPG